MNDHSPAPLAPTGIRGERSNCGRGDLMGQDGETSHAMVEEGLGVPERLGHRGARGAEPNTGDGAGLLIQKPHAFLGVTRADDGTFATDDRLMTDVDGVLEAGDARMRASLLPYWVS